MLYGPSPPARPHFAGRACGASVTTDNSRPALASSAASRSAAVPELLRSKTTATRPAAEAPEPHPPCTEPSTGVVPSPAIPGNVTVRANSHAASARRRRSRSAPRSPSPPQRERPDPPAARAAGSAAGSAAASDRGARAPRNGLADARPSHRRARARGACRAGTGGSGAVGEPTTERVQVQAHRSLGWTDVNPKVAESGCSPHHARRRRAADVDRLLGGSARDAVHLRTANLDRPTENHLLLLEAHKLRVVRGDYAISPIHLTDAIELLTERSRESLSGDRSPRDPYRRSDIPQHI